LKSCELLQKLSAKDKFSLAHRGSRCALLLFLVVELSRRLLHEETAGWLQVIPAHIKWRLNNSKCQWSWKSRISAARSLLRPELFLAIGNNLFGLSF